MTDFIDRLENELLAAGARSRGKRLVRGAASDAWVGVPMLLSLVIVAAVVAVLLAAGHGRRPAAADRTKPATHAHAPFVRDCTVWNALDGGGSALGQAPPFLSSRRPTRRCTFVAHFQSQLRPTLAPPAGGASPSGSASEFEHRGQYALSVVALGVPETSTDKYGVWVETTAGRSRLLGVVHLVHLPRAVMREIGGGSIRASGLLPARVIHFRQVFLTLETSTSPSRPGSVLLRIPEGPAPGATATCAAKVTSTPPATTSATPSAALRSTLGVLRTRATAADRVSLAPLFPSEFSPTNGVFVRYTRVVEDSGVKLIVVPYLRAGLVDPTCPGQAPNSAVVQQRAEERKLLAHPQEEVGVFARLGHATLGEFTYGTATEIRRGSTIAVDGVNTGYSRAVLVALVPDGVARVAVFYAGWIEASTGKRVPARPVTINMTVRENVVEGNVPRPAGYLPQRVTWYSPAGAVVKSYTP